jgi:hypothetical protein
MVEFDEDYFIHNIPRGIKLKPEKKSQKQKSVAVMVESTSLEDIKTGKKSKQCRYFKMKVLHSHK